MDPLFPQLPENLAELDDAALSALLDEHQVALDKIEADDPTYLSGFSADEILSALETGNAQIDAIRAEQGIRDEATAAFESRKAELLAQARGVQPEAEEPEAEVLAAGDSDERILVADIVEIAEGVAIVEAEPVAVVAAATPPAVYRRTPTPAKIQVISEAPPVASLVASAGLADAQPGTVLTRESFAELVSKTAKRLGRPMKSASGGLERTLVAQVNYPFGEERTLRNGDSFGNFQKIAKIGSPWLGKQGIDALVASGGLCAPLEPFYNQPNLSTAARPVRDALPNFMADRGGVSVPTPGTIADITTAISVITEENDALGGTFATKSCQDLTCPTWTDVAVTVIAHCREYGNLNAMAWPEGIAFQNDLTMAAQARTADGYLLTRIGTLSVAKTWDQSAESYGAVSGMIQALLQERAATISYLRMLPTTRFRALLPFWVAEAMAVDTVNTQFGRFDTPQSAISALLGRYNIDVSWYLDTADSAGQVYSASEAGAIVDFLDPVGYLYPEGTFLHIDSGDLELGIVRDSILNSTNDFQVFGETFENVARIGPAQAAKKITFSNFCPSGAVAAPKTAITC